MYMEAMHIDLKYCLPLRVPTDWTHSRSVVGSGCKYTVLICYGILYLWLAPVATKSLYIQCNATHMQVDIHIYTNLYSDHGNHWGICTRTIGTETVSPFLRSVCNWVTIGCETITSPSSPEWVQSNQHLHTSFPLHKLYSKKHEMEYLSVRYLLYVLLWKRVGWEIIYPGSGVVIHTPLLWFLLLILTSTKKNQQPLHWLQRDEGTKNVVIQYDYAMINGKSLAWA